MFVEGLKGVPRFPMINPNIIPKPFITLIMAYFIFYPPSLSFFYNLIIGLISPIINYFLFFYFVFFRQIKKAMYIHSSIPVNSQQFSLLLRLVISQLYYLYTNQHHDYQLVLCVLCLHLFHLHDT